MPTKPQLPDLGTSSAFNLYMKRMMEMEKQAQMDPLDLSLKRLRYEEGLQRIAEHNRKLGIVKKQMEIVNGLMKLTDDPSVESDFVKGLYSDILNYGEEHRGTLLKHFESILKQRAREYADIGDTTRIPDYFKNDPVGKNIFNIANEEVLREKYSRALGTGDLITARKLLSEHFFTDNDARKDLDDAIERAAFLLDEEGVDIKKINPEYLSGRGISADPAIVSMIKSKLRAIRLETTGRELRIQRGKQLVKKGEESKKQEGEKVVITINTGKGEASIEFNENPKGMLVISKINNGNVLVEDDFIITTGMTLSDLLKERNKLEKAIRDLEQSVPRNNEAIGRVARKIDIIDSIIKALEKSKVVSEKGKEEPKTTSNEPKTESPTPPQAPVYKVRLGAQ